MRWAPRGPVKAGQGPLLLCLTSMFLSLRLSLVGQKVGQKLRFLSWMRTLYRRVFRFLLLFLTMACLAVTACLGTADAHILALTHSRTHYHRHIHMHTHTAHMGILV
jgi:hypothetical protein